MTTPTPHKLEIGEAVLGNSNPRFSGVTSTMLQVLKHQQALLSLTVLGRYNLPSETPSITFLECARKLQTPLPDGRYRVFHARRNNEMLLAVALKYLFGAKIKIIFTATAQRHPSWITRWLISKADGLITTSTAAAAYLPREQDIIIPHGIDSERYVPPARKIEAWKSLGLPGDFGIGIFGRVRPQKGVDLLIDAMISIFQRDPHNKATVVIVGETTKKFEPYLQSLKDRIKEAGLEERFHFLGKQPFGKIPELFRGMSLVAALSRNEGYGLTVLEAMSSGCAVLATEAGAWKDILKSDAFGKIVPIDDLPSTKSALETLINKGPEALESMGQSARQIILEQYQVEKEAERLVNFYRTIQESTT